MKIGDLATRTHTAVETIRFYEREGLLPSAARTEANYRIYTEAHAQRLSFVRHCRSLDMTLDEIRLLLGFKDAPSDNCAAVNNLLDAHIGHVATRIRELRNLEKQLKELRQQCQDVNSAECGILSQLALSATHSKPPAPASHAHAHVHGTHSNARAQRERQAEKPRRTKLNDAP
ncbi:Cd(II)/Pb(II)-responsive transcriptional regulator [Rhodoferax aquaticus]|uniref:Cd(II)/Pb(II)-responsive transcriptional regulator n=1 Tax=Rhodoferax aquaticus TaxID=2527691 RepID=A0A515EWB0_9BURK|nr:Cd(II)/Pb(II)-responsive transcriptional regulator [Rhodoferax aquaticus]QDL56883.1 Cd(II)/Pb(II)-responsive transcriptional regulator [Rhodoferax aquaticus]